MMARATRSSTADLKRKRSVDSQLNTDITPTKQQRTENVPETLVDGQAILAVLETEDRQGLLDRVFPAQGAQATVSLRALLTSPSPVSSIKAAINHLRPMSSLPRARLSQTAAQQLAFCNLALSLLEQAPSSADHTQSTSILPDSPEASPARPKFSYALVQHLPSGDYWTSLASIPSPSDLSTANAELVAVFPTPSSSSSSEKPIPTLGSYSTKPMPAKKAPLPRRRVTTGAFLDYGPYSSFAPSFDQDGEIVGRNQLGQVLVYREERKRFRDAIRRERLEGTGSIVDITPEPQQSEPVEEADHVPDLELEALLPPEEVASIKAALGSLELEKSVQKLLERNQRALERLEVLQRRRLTNHPTSAADEESEEWETAQAILDSLTLLASLRPRSSSEDAPPLVPPPSVLHKLHRTLAIEPSPGWYGTLPPGRTTALRDDSTVKVRAGASAPAPAATTTTTTTTPAATAPVSATNTFGAYGYTYSQPPNYRPQQAAAGYTPYKPGQTPAYYSPYLQAGTHQQQAFYNQQSYGAGATSQQPYGTLGQQAYGYNWYAPQATQQQQGQQQNGTTSGRGTPQPIVATPTTVAPSYVSFFNQTAASGTAAGGGRTPAVANTVVGNTAAGGAGSTQTTLTGAIPTLPAHLRTAQAPAATNGSPSMGQTQQAFYSSYTLPQTQPAR